MTQFFRMEFKLWRHKSHPKFDDEGSSSLFHFPSSSSSFFFLSPFGFLSQQEIVYSMRSIFICLESLKFFFNKMKYLVQICFPRIPYGFDNNRNSNNNNSPLKHLLQINDIKTEGLHVKSAINAFEHELHTAESIPVWFVSFIYKSFFYFTGDIVVLTVKHYKAATPFLQKQRKIIFFLFFFSG